MDYGYPSDPGGLVLLLALMSSITGMTSVVTLYTQETHKAPPDGTIDHLRGLGNSIPFLSPIALLPPLCSAPLNSDAKHMHT